MSETRVTIEDEQARRLEQLAVRRRTPVEELVRRAIDMMLSEEPLADRTERWERSMALLGAVHSDVPDLAENHDRYLAEDFN